MPSYRDLMRIRDDGQRQIDTVCREICRLQAQHDNLLDVRGEAFFWKRLELVGEIVGLRKALCLLMDWPMEEAVKDGRADQFVQEWAAHRST